MAKDNPPSGCQHCGKGQRVHGIEYAEWVGYHSYVAPDIGTVKARMTARREERDARRNS